ncbi:MAG: hypothetical protein A3G33_05060 [Omnitrophica bacterium RIFCSPLOWO2_12_FULL_44_17]|uniref:FAD-binding FR-type domain-containing protein n=1 Tax=Candidatus Danuiimicrobium aquiferis TaxID=1801832 RepID=A0A1G1KX56_9BACT|nr:MAG: hypothetical protein A3B72_01430 [Omnitrophica bacterium RIFCSPHIGHO2_02_FULL_45_28]OGW89147.1 MAG: hypothetical protein A3E74_06225 [Omnitrophica bacterium RIFCSPHIGHO2_12_FULL_44_12]OGW97526.1 MAG: hypothetical protein A3G33_05060 [Omnitrophica bacterium RIFCSPLOWO2_12_FULL_44_17]OGX02079.1 MAG: hypothetical protein A3J12_06355 [Omnitrophica bacterium RIFCSPLOWO2_02_FULL_44_11]
MVKELDVKVSEVIERTAHVKSFRFLVTGEHDFKAGQWMLVNLNSDPELKRSLSISSSPTEPGYIEFTKKITQSDFSQKLSMLRTGDSISVKFPFGKFIYEDGFPKIVFLSGGIGITPVRSICQSIVDRKLSADVVLLYGNNSEADIAFRDDFDRMQVKYPNLRVVHILMCANANWTGRRGLIDAKVVKEEIPDYLERRFYTCGPPAMVQAMEAILLQELKVKKGSLIKESFSGY